MNKYDVKLRPADNKLELQYWNTCSDENSRKEKVTPEDPRIGCLDFLFLS